ncbi:cysteine desulfurase family protein [Salisediminibacterium selenitireducens]|uniref:cysteine desulfurase n=1 Tax=Bacillus selenitireducens (strain ATCC 700615 / DSM 15326 / MLS10) TaxID=439292 RepID=D6XWX2_BACIE|nr:cysteine desulfurase family protein [Salisediminibacterium selenitireducens]ADH99948.1 Cysteine desulfurase [[Bacillus] selenitireducens MLS10]
MKTQSIYLDHAATSPVYPEVVNAMMPYFSEDFGNPSSIHQSGRSGRKGMDQARELTGIILGARYDEVVFTSGGTESDNLAIFGAVAALRDKGQHVITAKTEHHAVLHACEQLEREGCEVTYLDVDQNGLIDVAELKKAIREDTVLATFMYGNNETGAVQPIRAIGEVLREHGILFHTDAVQAANSMPISFRELPVDLMSFTGHKLNGPKGTGVLLVKKGTPLYPRLFGGEQEKKRRPGTENVPGAVGFAKALEMTAQSRAENVQFYEDCRYRMLDVFHKQGIDIKVNSTAPVKLSHILNVSFPGVNVEQLLMNLDMEGVHVSSGSACTAGSIDPSHVLTAMYPEDPTVAGSAIRISFGYGHSLEDTALAAERISQVVKRLQKPQPHAKR